MLPTTTFMDVHDQDAALKPRRQASTQYILLDSQDRNQSGEQPWNNFSFQKPQAILDAFANRILVSEVQFPWFIPNITEYNNVLYVNTLPLTITPGFYTPSALVAALNAGLVTLGFPLSTFAYSTTTMQYTLTAGVGETLSINYSEIIPQPNFATTASLFKTLGFALPQANFSQQSGDSVTGAPTLSDYTPYVDIISNRLMRYTSVKDGESASNAQSAVICRIYASDETSTSSIVAGVPNTCAPFLIHRQFKNAKAVQWNKDAFVDYFDIQVIDQYNRLVPLPVLRLSTGDPRTFAGSYPDWQITMLASED